MIPINLIQKTAETLMDKAAIEIPQDYLDGLQEAARTEDGDLSSFVLKAMLENYEAAKEDRRAMCGDTGVPCPSHWPAGSAHPPVEIAMGALSQRNVRRPADPTWLVGP